MEFLNTIVILLTFGSIFYILYRWNKKDNERVDKILKTFETTIGGVLTSVEKTNNKFYDMTAKIEVEHFKQLEKSTDKQARFFEKQVNKFIELQEKQKKDQEEIIHEISRLDQDAPNSIEKEEDLVNPLADFDPSQFKDIKNVQFEGEEEIYPIGPTE